jgi:hypothetical protein
MTTQGKEKATIPPGVWQTIAAGFDLTAKHLWLVLLPALLDSFYWLGPRLSMRPLVERYVALLPADPAIADITAQFLTLAPRTNLFTSLSVPLLGLPALMVGAAPLQTPLPTQVFELESLGLWLVLFLLFSVVGVLLTAVYFSLIAQEVGRQLGNTPRLPLVTLFGQMLRLWVQLLGLTLLLLVLAVLVYVPLLPLSLLLGLFSVMLAALVLMTGPVLILWLIIYLFFAPHGLALHGRSLFQAVTESLYLVRAHLFSVVGLMMILFLGRNILATLLLLADDGSWLTLASILGHAFIMTSLVAATFIYYRDRYPAGNLLAE